LFYVTPVLPALWAFGATQLTHETQRVGGEMFVAGPLWGYAPAALAVGLMPVYLLLIEQAVSRESRVRLSVAALVGLAASWIHPWQGVTLAAITVALVLWDRISKRTRPLLLPIAAISGPLIGYAALGRVDDSWHHAQVAVHTGRPGLGYVLAAIVPLAIVAVFGLQMPSADVRERVLLTWPLASLGAYLVVPSFSKHALLGMSLPLAILAVRGLTQRPEKGVRVRLWTAVLLLTVPGVVYLSHWAFDFVARTEQGHLLTPGESKALRFLAMEPDRGGVLAPPNLGAAVPGWTGRASWVGHPSWTPSYRDRAQTAARLAEGRLSAERARRLVRESGARFVLTGCRSSVDLAGPLRPLLSAVHRFGCASLYEIRPTSELAR
jgi:hypothetical protein